MHAGTQPPVCWEATLRFSPSLLCLKLPPTRGITSYPLEFRTTKPVLQLLHRVVGVPEQFYKWQRRKSSLWFAA
jgi:hypothetical protein